MFSTWHLLLLSDSSLPVGGFAHSSGLESALVQGQITAENLTQFIVQSLNSQFYVFVPFVKQMLEILCSGECTESKLTKICTLDCNIEALISTSECQARASKTQATAYLTLLLKCYEKREGLDLILDFKKSVLRSESPGHFIICFCLINFYMSDSSDLDTLTQIVSLFLYLHMKSLVSSAIRLGIIGPYKGHSFCLQLTPNIDNLVRKLEDLQSDTTEGICINPVLEVLSAGHDRLYTRLFNS